MRELKTQNHLLNDIAKTISEVMEEEWAPIEAIHIFIGACPIAPRFLGLHWFLIPYYYETFALISISAHEMIHFLYFKKWSSLFPDTNAEKYERPNPEWVLSEILVAVIGNDSRIKKLVGSKFDLYENWQSIKYDDQKLLDIFTGIYDTSDSFDSFLRSSWNLYQKLDKEHQITKVLAGKPF